jgi:thioredoxin reductase
LVGEMPFREVNKETLLAFWTNVIRKTGLRIQFGERVEEVRRTQGGFAVRTTRSTYHAATVLLAIGRRGTPRKMEVPGEDLPKVVYRLIDPDDYKGQRVLVVGGGDSALEAAGSLAEVAGCHVTLSYRGEAFARAKTKNRRRIEELAAAGRVNVILGSRVLGIEPDRVALRCGEEDLLLPNDAVIVCAGGILPTDFLKQCGIDIETKYGTS